MDRKKQQAELLMKLGAFIKPFEDYATYPERYDTHALARLFARGFVERNTLDSEMAAFSSGEPGHRYSIQYDNFSYNLHVFMRDTATCDSPDHIKTHLSMFVPKLQNSILETMVCQASSKLTHRSRLTVS